MIANCCEASSGTGYVHKRDRFWIQFPFVEITFLLFLFFFSLGEVQLSFATQHAMPPEFGGKWRAECVNTRLPPSTLKLSDRSDLTLSS